MKVIGQRTGLVWPGDVRTLDELCRREFEQAEADGVHLNYRPYWRWTAAKERAFLRSLNRRGRKT